MEQFYPYFIDIHVVFSILFLLSGLYISAHSFVGWVKKNGYARFDNLLRYTFLVLLYGDLALGVILYFFLKKPNEVMTAEEAIKNTSLRFWAIQHFSNMIFVVILCIIGNLLIKKTRRSIKKHQYSFLYFGFSTLIIIISVGVFIFRQ